MRAGGLECGHCWMVLRLLSDFVGPSTPSRFTVHAVWSSEPTKSWHVVRSTATGDLGEHRAVQQERSLRMGGTFQGLLPVIHAEWVPPASSLVRRRPLAVVDASVRVDHGVCEVYGAHRLALYHGENRSGVEVAAATGLHVAGSRSKSRSP